MGEKSGCLSRGGLLFVFVVVSGTEGGWEGCLLLVERMGIDRMYEESGPCHGVWRGLLVL